MILGRPTTRAMFARILVGIGVGVSVGLFAGPAHAWRLPFAFASSNPGAAAERPSTPGSAPGETAPPEAEVVPAGETPAVVPRREDATAPPPAVSSPAPIPQAAPPAVAAPGISSLDAVTEVPPSVPPSRRPRFALAAGMGGSFDGSGLVKGRTVLAPAFWFQGGIGDGPLGFEVRMLSTQASGRFHQMCNGVSDTPVDRLAVDVLFALRPLASEGPQDPHWVARVARSWALNIGASGENASVNAQSAFRLGVLVGSHIDLPVSPTADGTELRVRLGVRRMWGGQGVAGPVTVSDTVADLFGGLAAAF